MADCIVKAVLGDVSRTGMGGRLHCEGSVRRCQSYRYGLTDCIVKAVLGDEHNLYVSRTGMG